MQVETTSSRPVCTLCTCASTKAGVTSRPPRASRATFSPDRPTSSSPPTATIRPSPMSTAVAWGRPADLDPTGVQEQRHYTSEISGRFSYAVDKTVVVWVEHFASARILASSLSRCVMVGTWTLSR